MKFKECLAHDSSLVDTKAHQLGRLENRLTKQFTGTNFILLM